MDTKESAGEALTEPKYTSSVPELKREHAT